MNKQRLHYSKLCMELIGTNPLQTLHQASRMGIVISDIKKIDALTVHFKIPGKDYQQLDILIQQGGGRLSCRKSYGFYQNIYLFFSRPILVLGCLIMMLLTIYLPKRILFIEVIGNQSIATQEIVEAAAECGIEFGASRKAIRSEKVKNRLLEKIPRLQWLGLNTHGCTAIISVQEKSVIPSEKSTVSISSIVASRDGVIQNMIISSGTAVCKPGQVVQKGQLLVSGYSDCGICIHGTKSEADILASTQHDLEVVTPVISQKISHSTEQSKKYSLIIGKKRINFYKGSGISTPTCGKMYEENCITLPGGFQLPIALVTETIIDTAIQKTDLSPSYNASVLSNFVSNYLKENMVAGQVISSNENLCRKNQTDCLRGTYMCREMIGRVRIEETIEENGKTD